MKEILQISISTTILLFVSLIFCRSLSAQSLAQDSLVNRFETVNSDLERYKIALQLARSLDFYQKEQSIKYYKEALKYGSNQRESAEIMDTIGFYNWQLGNLEEAIKFYSESEIIFNALKDSLWLGRIYNSIGVCHWQSGKGNDALQFYQKAVKIRKAISDNNGTSRVLNNIGIVYMNWGLSEEAMKFYKEALNYAQIGKDNYVIAFTYSNLGGYYENIKNYDSALVNYNIGYQILVRKNEINKLNSYFSEFFGDVYSATGKQDSALFYYRKSLAYANRINNKNRLSIAEYNMAKTFFGINQTDSAKRYANSSYKQSLEKNYQALQKDNLLLLSKISEKENNIQSAYSFLRLASDIKDSLINSEEIAKFSEMQKRYVSEQAEKENQLLRKDLQIQELTIERNNNVRYILITSIILFLIIIFVIIRSRSSLKKLNRKLKESEKELRIANINKDKFFAIIAHDLRGPFNGLLGMSNLLSEKFYEFPDTIKKEMVESLRYSSTKVFALLESLLQWARIQSGKMEYDFEEFNLCEKCKEVTELLQPIAQAKNIHLRNEVNLNTIVWADINAIETILRNLITNAIKFTNEGGTVSIEAKIDQGVVFVSVTDTGIGITENIRNNLFRIDISTSTSGTNNESGTGLGLILCKEMIEKHNGTITIDSEPGKGSKFTFSLPVK